MELKTTFIPAKGTKAHQDTILAGPVLPEGMPAPFDHAWGYLDKPGEMEYHKHYKEEVYFFFKGTGFVRIDGEEMPVAPRRCGAHPCGQHAYRHQPRKRRTAVGRFLVAGAGVKRVFPAFRAKRLFFASSTLAAAAMISEAIRAGHAAFLLYKEILL